MAKSDTSNTLLTVGVLAGGGLLAYMILPKLGKSGSVFAAPKTGGVVGGITPGPQDNSILQQILNALKQQQKSSALPGSAAPKTFAPATGPAQKFSFPGTGATKQTIEPTGYEGLFSIPKVDTTMGQVGLVDTSWSEAINPGDFNSAVGGDVLPNLQDIFGQESYNVSLADQGYAETQGDTTLYQLDQMSSFDDSSQSSFDNSYYYSYYDAGGGISSDWNGAWEPVPYGND